jgi:hypothetical protein
MHNAIARASYDLSRNLLKWKFIKKNKKIMRKKVMYQK